MQAKSKKKILQSLQYELPYHYIPQFNENFINYKSYLSWDFSFQYIFAIKKISECLKNNKPKKFLDIGCGDGRLINFLSKKHNSISFTGIDYDPLSIKWAKILNQKPNVNFISDKLKNLKKNNFDTVCVIETLEHINPNELIFFCEEIKKKVSKGGNLYITVPHKNKDMVDKHFQHFDCSSLTNLFSDQFKIIELSGFPKQNICFRILNKIFYNRYWFWEVNLINHLKIKFYKLTENESKIERIFLHLKKK